MFRIFKYFQLRKFRNRAGNAQTQNFAENKSPQTTVGFQSASPENIEKKEFDKTVYFPLTEAVAELSKRGNNKELDSYIERTVPEKIPSVLRGKKSLVLFRHVATTNYEIIRFLSLVNAFNDLDSFILEYTSDKFLDRNELKHALGRLRFHKGFNKLGEEVCEKKVVINFNKSNNTPISEVETFWGEKLVDFHHELFFRRFPNFKGNVCDVSDWVRSVGDGAKTYYKHFLSLFLKDAILFENFLLEGKEKQFTQSVILPAIREITEESGFRPLIVALEPTDIEGDKFWLSHPYDEKNFVEEKLKQVTKENSK